VLQLVGEISAAKFHRKNRSNALNQPKPPTRDSFWKSSWSYSPFAEYAREATTVDEIG
jgi:hypothetical protein